MICNIRFKMVSWNWSLSKSEVITLKHQTQVLNDSDIIVLYCIVAFLNIFEFAPKTLKIIWLSNFSTFSIPDEGYSRSASCAINLISTVLFQIICIFLSFTSCFYWFQTIYQFYLFLANLLLNPWFPQFNYPKNSTDAYFDIWQIV